MRQISSLKQLWGMRACLDVFLSYCIFKPGDKVLSWASTRSISVGPGLLLQRSRVRFTQGSFPWLNCLCSEPGLLFHSFCGKLSKSNWGKLSISASSRSQMFTAHSGMEVRVKTNTTKTQEQAPNYFNLSEMTPSAEKNIQHGKQRTNGQHIYLTWPHKLYFMGRHRVCQLKTSSAYGEPRCCRCWVCFTAVASVVRSNWILPDISGIHKWEGKNKI